MKIGLISICFVSTLIVNAQSSADFGFFGGGMYYLGEINQSTQFNSIKPSAGLLYRYNLTNRHSLRANVIYGTISGSDANSKINYQKHRNLSFQTSIIDIGLHFEFNFEKYLVGSTKYEEMYSPYVFVGASYCFAENTEKPHQITIPFGLGYKFNLTKKMSAGIEWSFRKTFTDKLDAIEGVDYNAIPEIAGNASFVQTGYLNDKDWYSIIGVYLIFKMGEKSICNDNWSKNKSYRKNVIHK